MLVDAVEIDDCFGIARTFGELFSSNLVKSAMVLILVSLRLVIVDNC